MANAYKILRYGPPKKEYVKKRKQETYHQSQQDFSGNYQRENAQQHFHDKSQQEHGHSSNRQESYEKEQTKQSNKQEHQQQQAKERKPDLRMPSTISEACTVLGTQPGLPLEEYKRIWKKEALRYHPDRTRDLGERLQKYAEEEMKRINKAWEIIKSAA